MTLLRLSLLAGLLLALLLAALPAPVMAASCPETVTGEKRLFWGDLHVHSAYSLDAWGFGTAATPAQAYAYAKGAPLTLPDGQVTRLSRPLDFMAVTDHAEWFNLMYVCTDPLHSDDPYCRILTEKNSPTTGGEVFAEYVVPTITKAVPEPTPLCTAQPELCQSAHQSQWQRLQAQTNEANVPCTFTAFNAFEWSATPDFSHNHRNVIFAGEQVVPDAIDYLRYPTPQLLWRELERQCRAEDGCEAIAIPHNTNMGDGKSFDVETESPADLALRAKYEQLVEIHQEKGNSECLPAFGAVGATDEDCAFEPYLTKRSRPAAPADFSEVEWERMRGSYVRRLLLRGLYSYEQSGASQLNPLQLGIIGSTDGHMATGGFTDDASWPGSVFGLGDFERAMQRADFNPGGLMAVWAEENTRESLFAALQRREVYATSGPRLRVRLQADFSPLGCSPASGTAIGSDVVPMGGTLRSRPSAAAASAPRLYLTVQAQADQTPLAAVELVKGQVRDGQLQEQVVQLWQNRAGAVDVCAAWEDPDFDPNAPAFWYARVLQTPTPRWTAYHCQREGRCDEYPDADRWIQERAWTSPVWHLPEFDQ